MQKKSAFSQHNSGSKYNKERLMRRDQGLEWMRHILRKEKESVVMIEIHGTDDTKNSDEEDDSLDGAQVFEEMEQQRH